MKIFNKTLGLLLTLGLFSPIMAFAQEAEAAPEGTQTILGEVSTFGEFISLVWSYGSQVIIALAVFFIILGAFFYVASAGDEAKISQGKQMIIGSLVAIVIVILSGVLVRTLHKPAEGTAGALTDVPQVINNASNLLVGLIGAFTVFMFVYAGLMYVTARGDTEKVSKAHSALKYAVFGLVIGVFAFAIVNTALNYFL